MSIYYAEGRYRCKVIEQGLGEAKTGTPQFVLRVKVLETENGEPVKTQYERTSFQAITDRTMPYVAKKLAALGFNENSLRYLDPAVDGYQDFVGQMVLMECKYEPDLKTNEDREKWDICFGGAGDPLDLKPVDPYKLKNLDILFGESAKVQKAPAGSKAPVAPRPASAPRSYAAPRQQAAPEPPSHPSEGYIPNDTDLPF